MRWSLWYWCWKQIVGLALEVFYRRVEVSGQENIPEGKPILFAVNHQNAFMDAIVTVCWMRPQSSFLVRADVFGNPVGRAFLQSLKMMPIYRPRDKVDDLLVANQVVFDKCYRRLSRNQAIIIFPEGSHGHQKRLRPLRKGVARIGFGAMEQYADLDVHIVPVGLDYSVYNKSQSNLVVQYGEAMPLRTYFEQYQTQPAQAISALRKDLHHRIKQLLLHIPGDANYETVRQLSEMAAPTEVKSPLKRLQAAQSFVKHYEAWQPAHPEEAKELRNHLEAYQEGLKTHKLRDWLFDTERFPVFLNWLALLISAPIALFGLVNNYLPWMLPAMVVKKIVKDRQFESSILVAAGLVFFGLFWTLQTVLVGALIGPWWLALVYLALLPISGLITLWWRRTWLKQMGWLRFKNLQKKQPSDFELLQTTRQFLCSEIKNLNFSKTI